MKKLLINENFKIISYTLTSTRTSKRRECERLLLDILNYYVQVKDSEKVNITLNLV